VIRRDGSMVGRMDHVFKDLVNVREAQIVQEDPGRITIRIVRGAFYCDRDEKYLLAEIGKRLGSETDVKIDYRESLPRGSGGKLRFVVSTLHNGRIGRTGMTPQGLQASPH
jgi:phenylacetate-CoA ligase